MITVPMDTMNEAAAAAAGSNDRGTTIQTITVTHGSARWPELPPALAQGGVAVGSPVGSAQGLEELGPVAAMPAEE